MHSVNQINGNQWFPNLLSTFKSSPWNCEIIEKNALIIHYNRKNKTVQVYSELQLQVKSPAQFIKQIDQIILSIS